MVGNSSPSFGDFARQTRIAAGLGLREAARQMGYSSSYLSRVENDIDRPSPDLMVRMSKLYGIDVEDLTARAHGRSSAAAHGRAIQSSAELRALYRMASKLNPADIDKILRQILKEKDLTDEEIERELAQLKSELPRIANRGREDLLAAQVKPRWLSKKQISHMANRVLAGRGLTPDSYVPPTPIELVVERVPGVTYRIEKLRCRNNGEPLVLGLTGLSPKNEPQIIMNAALADSPRSCDQHRFNFTLAHELFHGIEHLRELPAGVVSALARAQVFLDGDGHLARPQRSAAEKAVQSWAARETRGRRLQTDEDWREWQANTFSSALLMPDWAVLKEFKRRTGEESIGVESGKNPRETALEIAGARHFGRTFCGQSMSELFAVSRQAMAIRLLELGLVAARRAEGHN